MSGDSTGLLFSVFDSVLTSKSAIYAAGPLDTGRSYYEAVSRGEGTTTIRDINQARLSDFVAHLRELHCPTPVIDPGLLRVEGWTPKAIGDLFLSMITRYAKEAWFIDGWEYSSGATKEYLHCLAGGIPCYASRGTPLTLDVATELLRSALDDLAIIGVDAPKLNERLAAFTTVAGKVGLR